jgi:two-component system, response regulator, stage 0 sporulation protein A
MNNNISVLIADDNEDLAKELSSYIGAKPNMTVTAIATDGEDAYTLISQTRPDIIILDLVMPKLDGIGVLNFINTNLLCGIIGIFLYVACEHNRFDIKLFQC